MLFPRRRGCPPPRAGRRAPLLQPGAGPAARGTRPLAAHTHERAAFRAAPV